MQQRDKELIDFLVSANPEHRRRGRMNDALAYATRVGLVKKKTRPSLPELKAQMIDALRFCRESAMSIKTVEANHLAQRFQRMQSILSQLEV